MNKMYLIEFEDSVLKKIYFTVQNLSWKFNTSFRWLRNTSVLESRRFVTVFKNSATLDPVSKYLKAATVYHIIYGQFSHILSFLQIFLQNNYMHFSFPTICYIFHPSHLTLFNYYSNKNGMNRSWSISFCIYFIIVFLVFIGFTHAPRDAYEVKYDNRKPIRIRSWNLSKMS